MHNKLRSHLIAGTILGISCVTTFAQDPTAKTLQPFLSKKGGFNVSMPGKPSYSSKKNAGRLGKQPVVHHQFLVGGAKGVFMATYELIPDVKLDTPEQIEAGYLRARDGMVKVLQGKVLEYKKTKLDKRHDGRLVRISIPGRKGEYRARMFIVGDRFYQVFAMGEPDFVKSKQADKVLASFKLAKETKTTSKPKTKK